MLDARPGHAHRSLLLATLAVALVHCAALLAARAQGPGTLDTTFNTGVSGGTGYVLATAVQPDGKTIIAGNFTTVGAASHANIARLNADGNVDASFTASTDNDVHCVAVQNDGKIVLGGNFTSVNGSAVNAAVGVNRIARLNVDGTLDTAFNTSGGSALGGTNGAVYSVAVQTDGKLVLGGAFSRVNGSAVSASTGVNHMARLNADGTLDTAFNSSGGIGLGGANDDVRAVVVQTDGRIVLGGFFTSVNGVGVSGSTGVNRIARLNANGTLDTAFNVSGGTGLGGTNGAVYSVAVQADGKIVLGGDFTSVNGSIVNTVTGVNRIARLNPDGTLETAFNTSSGTGLGGTNGIVYSVAVQADGKLVLGGAFNSVNGSSGSAAAGVNYFTRLNADGTRDPGFDASGGTGLGGADNEVRSVAVQPDGRILLGGFFSNINGTARSYLARLSNDSSIQTLSTPGTTTVRWERRGGGPSIIGSVTFEQSTDGGANYASLGMGTRVARAETWQLTGLSLPSTGLLRARGRVAGGSHAGSSGYAQQLEDFGPAGSVASSYDPSATGGLGNLACLAVQPDGKAIVAGDFTTVGGQAHTNLARLNADGSVDASFGGTANGSVTCVALQADGKIILGGTFSKVNGVLRSYIARLNSDGSLESTTTFNPGSGADSFVDCIAIQPNGNIVIGGFFSKYNGTTSNRIARLNADGSLESTATFNPGSGMNNYVMSLALQADGKIVMGGGFTTVNGVIVNRVARLNANGSRDSTFNPGTGADDDVYSVAVQGDGKILIGGAFTTINGTARAKLSRLNSNGSLESTTSFNPGTGPANVVSSIALQADGKILIAGTFTAVNGSTMNKFARLNANGSLESTATFDPGSGAGGNVNGVSLQPDGKILLAGLFTNVNGTARSRVARLNNSAATQTLTAPDTTQVLWSRSGTAPEVSGVTFETSTDGGSSWTPRGLGTRVGTTANWQLTGLALPIAGQLRARGRSVGGKYNGCSGLIEQVADYAMVIPPTVVVNSATSVTTAAATLNATVTSNYAATDVIFQASTDATLSSGIQTTVSQTLDAVDRNIMVRGPVGLSPHTTYYFRAVATNSAGTTNGAILSFTTGNTTPTAPNGTATGTTGDQKTVTINFPATDADSDTVAITGASFVSGLTVDAFTANTVTFTPLSSFTGSGSFTYTVDDHSGTANATANGTITVTITDNDPPVITTPGNLTATATTPSGAVVNFSVSARDAVSGAVTATPVPASGSTFPVGTTTVTVTARDGASNPATATFTVTVSPLTSAQCWRYQYFQTIANSGDAADSADPDHDGVTNLDEFAFGTDPTNPNSGPPALIYNGTFAGQGTLISAGQPAVRLESPLNGPDARALHVRRTSYAASGLVYSVEFSADLMNWEPSATMPTVLADDGTLQVVSIPYPPMVNGSEPRFFQVLVTAPAP